MTVEVEERENGVVVIELNQKGGNKFTHTMLDDLYKALENYSMENARGMILTGSGRAFSVGGDLIGMKESLEDGSPQAYVDLIVPLINRIILSIVSHELPIVSAINGAAAGGGLSLALATDYRVSLPDAKLSMAFGKVGLSPDSGSSVIFPLRFGNLASLRGIPTGMIILASEALSSGAINEIAEASELIQRAEEFILDVTSVSTWSFAKTKELMNQSLMSQLKHNLELEHQLIRNSSKRDEFETKLDQLLASFKS